MAGSHGFLCPFQTHSLSSAISIMLTSVLLLSVLLYTFLSSAFSL